MNVKKQTKRKNSKQQQLVEAKEARARARQIVERISQASKLGQQTSQDKPTRNARRNLARKVAKLERAKIHGKGIVPAIQTHRASSLNKMLSKFRSNQNVPIVRQWQKGSDLQLRTGFQEVTTHDRTKIIGSEYISSITVNTTLADNARKAGQGEILFRQPMNPIMIPGTRLKQLAEMFQTYDVKHMAFHLCPIVPATQNGSIMMGVTFDPDIDMTSMTPGESSLRVFMSMENFELINVYQPASSIWNHNIMNGLWVRAEDDDARLSVPGHFVVLTASSYTPFDGVAKQMPLYNVFMTYDVEFHNRGLIPNQSIPASGEVHIDGTLDNIFAPTTGTAVDDGDPVCILESVQTLAPFKDNYMYILECVVLGSSTQANSSWSVNGVGPLFFQTDGPNGTFEMAKGAAFYLFFDNSTGDPCFSIATTLSSAFRRETDFYWVSNIADLGATSGTVDFAFRAITIS